MAVLQSKSKKIEKILKETFNTDIPNSITYIACIDPITGIPVAESFGKAFDQNGSTTILSALMMITPSPQSICGV